MMNAHVRAVVDDGDEALALASALSEADAVKRLRGALTACLNLLDVVECHATDDEGYLCTLPAGHPGAHEAWGSDPLRTWRDVEATTR